MMARLGLLSLRAMLVPYNPPPAHLVINANVSKKKINLMMVKLNQRITTNGPIIDYLVKKHEYGQILTFVYLKKICRQHRKFT
jgi:hypothetical protein